MIDIALPQVGGVLPVGDANSPGVVIDIFARPMLTAQTQALNPSYIIPDYPQPPK